jgi:hypothetical protein
VDIAGAGLREAHDLPAGIDRFRQLQIQSGVGARKWQREQTAAEPLRGRTATSILFLSALKWACW